MYRCVKLALRSKIDIQFRAEYGARSKFVIFYEYRAALRPKSIFKANLKLNPELNVEPTRNSPTL